MQAQCCCSFPHLLQDSDALACDCKEVLQERLYQCAQVYVSSPPISGVNAFATSTGIFCSAFYLFRSVSAPHISLNLIQSQCLPSLVRYERLHFLMCTWASVPYTYWSLAPVFYARFPCCSGMFLMWHCFILCAFVVAKQDLMRKAWSACRNQSAWHFILQTT